MLLDWTPIALTGPETSLDTLIAFNVLIFFLFAINVQYYRRHAATPR